jgi:hypothetical protein
MLRLQRRARRGAPTERLGVCAFVYQQPHRPAERPAGFKKITTKR